MPTPRWLTAAGVAGAVVIGAGALIAVAATGPSAKPTSTTSTGTSRTTTPSASPSPTPEGTETISAAEAVQIAESHLTGVGELVIEEVDLKPEDGRLIWDVEFEGDREVEIDAVVGSVVKLEISGDDRNRGDDDDHGDDDHGDDDHGDDDHGDNGDGDDGHGDRSGRG
jgi:hypothetical protein